MFRVVPDQLKISEGWVRCGHCSEVFDATAHMTDEAAVAAAAQAALHEPPPMVRMPSQPSPASIAAAHAPQPHADPDSELRESPLDQPFVFRRSDMGDGDDLPSVRPPAAPSGFEASSSLDPEDDDLHRQVSFMRQARRRAFWTRPAMRVLLLLLALVLTALLGAQVAMREHDRIAAIEPALKPWLQTICEPLGCRVGAPRQIESVAIDGSSFSKLRGDAYRLNFTLRNAAAFAVEAPAMELTLTDAQDQAVLRRVLAPGELGSASGLVPAGGEWAASVALSVNANGQASRIAGYRLLAFYP